MAEPNGKGKPEVQTSTEAMVELYNREIDVELAGRLKSGSHAAYRLRQLRWIDYQPLGGVPATRPNGAGELAPDRDSVAAAERIAFMRRLVAMCIVGQRVCVRYGDGPWVDEWRPIRVVEGPADANADPPQVSLSEAADVYDNAVRMFNALMRDIEHGGGLSSTEGKSFHNGADGGDGVAGGAVREVAPRVGARPRGRPRRTDPARSL